ncbi:MAG: acyltransferase [Bryobacteraceae bacterium]
MATTVDINQTNPSLQLCFLAPYRRITSTGQFIPEIDGLRFLAIFSVYIYHLTGDVMRHSVSGYHQSVQSNGLFLVTQILNVGVPLFFVISGFILGLPFAESHRNLRKPVSLKKYFWRRVTRLEPPYFLCLLLFFILKITTARGSATGLLPNLIASIFYVHNPIFGRPSDIDFVAWSLEIEIQFYILAPVLGWLFAIGKASTRRFVLAAAVLLASIVSSLVSSHPPLQLSLLAYAQYFLAGFLLVEYYLDGGERRKNWLWDFVSVAAVSSLLFLLVRGAGRLEWTIPWLILALFIASFRGVAINRFVTNPWIATIGGMCYTIYLLHNYSIAALGMVTERLSPTGQFAVRLLIQFLVITPLVLAISALYFRFIERPCMRPDWPQQLRSAFLRIKSRRFLAWTTW